MIDFREPERQPLEVYSHSSSGTFFRAEEFLYWSDKYAELTQSQVESRFDRLQSAPTSSHRLCLASELRILRETSYICEDTRTGLVGEFSKNAAADFRAAKFLPDNGRLHTPPWIDSLMLNTTDRTKTILLQSQLFFDADRATFFFSLSAASGQRSDSLDSFHLAPPAVFRLEASGAITDPGTSSQVQDHPLSEVVSLSDKYGTRFLDIWNRLQRTRRLCRRYQRLSTRLETSDARRTLLTEHGLVRAEKLLSLGLLTDTSVSQLTAQRRPKVL